MADRRKRGRGIAARRQQLEQLIEQAIEALDALDGDPDLEPEEDRCEAHDDDPAIELRGRSWEIGSEDDCEDSDEDCGPAEDEPNFSERGWTPWGARSLGPGQSALHQGPHGRDARRLRLQGGAAAMRQRTSQQFHAGTVAQLAALITTPHPDGAFIAASDRLAALVEQRRALHRQQGKGSAALYHAFFEAHWREIDQLRIWLTHMEPRTLLGHQARAAAALPFMPDKDKTKTRALLALLHAVAPAEVMRRRETMAALLPDIPSGGIIGEFLHAAIGGLVNAAHEVAA